jgi:nitroreductase
MIEEIIRKRKSIRQFNKKNIPIELIYEAIETSKFAPSGKNRQPWKVKILSDNEKLDLINILNNKKDMLAETGSLSISIDAIKQSNHTLLIFNPYSYREKPYSRNKLLMDTQSIGAFVQNLL